MFGLACDNLVSAEVVTADGDVLTASADENSDLFWALHGGGGNFGVATSLSLRLHPLGPVTAALLFWPPEAGPTVLQAYRDFIMEAPDEIGGGSLYLTGPDFEFVPPELVGKLALALLVIYAGGQEAGRKAMAPMLALGHAGEMIAEMPYAELQCMLDDPPGFRNYWSAEYLGSLPNEAVELFCKRATDMIVPSASQHVLFPAGGATARETADWPVPWRRAPWCVHPFGLWTDPADDDRGRKWAHDIRADLKPWATGDIYLNFIGDEGDERLIAGFGKNNYRRLRQVKAKYDPNNVFHVNHNIRPA
jgi:FAD/FMN-containing dehydrogenase